MSTRLHVGRTDDPLYDVVIDDVADALEKAEEFFFARSGSHKVRIGDVRLFEEVDAILDAAFSGVTWPESVSHFYCGDRSISHPTREELDEWLY